MHTRRHIHTYIFCGPGLEECWVSLQPPPPSQEIRLHHTCPPHFIPFQSVPPKSCHIFIWAWWLWQICQMTHIHKHTHLWTHKGTQTEGRLLCPGRDQRALNSSYKTLGGWGQSPALNWTVLPSFVPGRCQDRQQESLRHERHLQGSGMIPLKTQLKECSWLPLVKLFDLLGAHQNTVRTNLVWEWCFYGCKTIILNIS